MHANADNAPCVWILFLESLNFVPFVSAYWCLFAPSPSWYVRFRHMHGYIQTTFGVAPSHPTTYQNLPAPRIFCFFGSPKGNRKRWQNCGCSSTTLTGARMFPKTSMEETNWANLIESPNNMIFDVQWPRTYISRVCFIYSHGKVISHFFSYYRFHNVHHYLQHCRSYLVDRYYMVVEDVCWASFLELWNLMESLNDVDSSTTLSTPRVAHEV